MGGSARQAEVQESQTLPMPAPHFLGQGPLARVGLTPLHGFGMHYSCRVLAMAPISSCCHCVTSSHWAQPGAVPAPSPSAPATDPLTPPCAVPQFPLQPHFPPAYLGSQGVTKELPGLCLCCLIIQMKSIQLHYGQIQVSTITNAAGEPEEG